MGRMYMSYLNEGKRGYTWASLVAFTLGAYHEAMTAKEISVAIWGNDLPPLLIQQQVCASLDKLIDRGFVAYYKAPKTSRSWYEYLLTAAGLKEFEPPKDFNASDSSDSKAFKPQPSRKVIKFRKRRAA